MAARSLQFSARTSTLDELAVFAAISMVVPIDNSESSILARAFGAASDAMTPGATRYLLGLTLAPEDIARMTLFAEKSRRGNASEAEREKLESLCRVDDLLGILQSKARMIVQR